MTQEAAEPSPPEVEPRRRAGIAVLLWAAGGLVTALLVFLSLFTLFGQWQTGEWGPWDQVDDLSSQEESELVRSCATITAGLAAAAAAAISIRKQRSTEHSVETERRTARISADAQKIAANAYVLDRLRAEREWVDRLRERYTTCAEQLGHKSPSVRLAGVYAMAALADSWLATDDPVEAQVCIDVLCAYFRTPPHPSPSDPADADQDTVADVAVREAITDVITLRLRPGSGRSWQGMRFDFRRARFAGRHEFDGAEWSGETHMDLTSARVLSGGALTFDGCRFAGGTVDFDNLGSRGTTSFRNAHFADGDVDFRFVGFMKGRADFTGAKFVGASVIFERTQFSGGLVLFESAQFTAGDVLFDQVELDGAQVRFTRAQFQNHCVEFVHLEEPTHGGSLDFTRRRAEQGACVGPWGGIPPDGLWDPSQQAQKPPL